MGSLFWGFWTQMDPAKSPCSARFCFDLGSAQMLLWKGQKWMKEGMNYITPARSKLFFRKGCEISKGRALVSLSAPIWADFSGSCDWVKAGGCGLLLWKSKAKFPVRKQAITCKGQAVFLGSWFKKEEKKRNKGFHKGQRKELAPLASISVCLPFFRVQIVPCYFSG